MLLWSSTPWPETGAHRSSDEVMIPATIPKTEGIVRERREPRAAMGGGRRTRGGLCTRRDREGRSLGEVEEGVGMLTVEAIELWWPNAGD